MPVVFRYFWFIAAGFMLVNIAIWRRRLAVLVANGTATSEEIGRFVRGLAVWLVGMPILLGTIALGAGWDSPICAGFLSFGNAAQSLVTVIMMTPGVFLMWWIWLGNGAEFLARIGPALGKRPAYDRRYSPRVVRLVITAMMLFSTVGAVVNYRILSNAPDMGCRVTESAPPR